MQLINGDALEEIKKIEDNSVDLIIADPDYDIGLQLDKKQIHGKTNGKKGGIEPKELQKILMIIYNFFLRNLFITQKEF